MYLRLIAVLMLVFVVSGCATTRGKGEHEQLQTRVTELEKKLEEKDAEIVDLQYEVKDLSGKVSTTNVGSVDKFSEESYTEIASKTLDASGIVRVNVSPERIQTALKNAGAYTGKVDGKIGAGTKAAIVEFQKSQGLKADGILGKRTWENLKTFLN